MSSQISENVAIFWDYENCPAPANTNGCAIANSISTLTRPFGSIKVFKAYFEISDQSKSMSVRSELQSSGVSVVDCPHNGRKDVADKMILVDMLSYAIDNPAPCTIVLITSDRDFAYALSILKNRHYRVILVKRPDTHLTLTFQASVCFDWLTDVVNQIDCPTPEPQRQRHRSQSAGDRIGSSATDTNDTGDVVSLVRNDRPSQDQPQVNKFCDSPPEGRGVTSTPGSHRRDLSVPVSIPLQGKQKKAPLGAPKPEPDLPVSVAKRPSFDSSPSIIPSDLKAILQAIEALPNFGAVPQFVKASDPVTSLESQIDAEDHYPEISFLGSTPTSAVQFNPGIEDMRIANTISPNPSTGTTLSSLRFGQFSPMPADAPVVPPHFVVLVEALQWHRSKGEIRPLRSTIGARIGMNGVTYRKAGVNSFREYTCLAEKEGMIVMGGTGGRAWMMLLPKWTT